MPPEALQRSKKLIRQVKKYLGDEDAEQHFLAIAAYLKIMNAPDIQADLPDQIGDFLTAVDAAYAEYEDRLKTTLRSMDLSSEELNVTNRMLENLNASISAMMDGLGQGLVFFDKQGVCAPIFSRISEYLLDGLPGGKMVSDILNLDAQQRENFDLWLSIIFEKTSAMSFDDLADLAPDHFINRAGQYIQLDYRPLKTSSGEMTGVLMIATDKTQERRVQNDLVETQRKSAMIVSIARNRNSFRGFIKNLQIFFNHVGGGEETRRVEILRELHTYKGLAYMFHLEALGDLMNQAEDQLKLSDEEMVRSNQIELVLGPVRRGLSEAMSTGELLFGEDFVNHGNVRMIEMGKILKLKSDLSAPGVDMNSVVDFINRDFLGVPFTDCLSTFQTELIRAAGMKGRPEPTIRINNPDTRLMVNEYEEFFESLVHLARNIMDHAIEDAGTRTAKGKPPGGQIDITLAPHESGWAIQIRDDGRGFDLPAIRARAVETGIAPGGMSDHEIIQFIFHPGFSTKVAMTDLSGRGVGMYAIKKAVEDLGGTVSCAIPESGPGAIISVILP